jgi:predicted permease
LRKDVSISTASGVAQLIGSRRENSTRGSVTSAEVVPLRADNLTRSVSRDTQLMIAALSGLGILVLTIICTNVSAVVVGRAATRRREIGVRLSLGATRLRLIRQLMTESAVLALAGGALGLALLTVAVRVVNARIPDTHIEFGIWTVAGTGLLAFATSVVFGLSPALFATRTTVGESLKNAGSTTTRTIRIQRRLIVCQIALSQPLLVGVGLLIATTVQEERARISTTNRDNTAVFLLGSGFVRDKGQEERITAQVRDARQLLAGHTSVGGAAYGAGWNTPEEFKIEGASDRVRARVRPVGPDFFRVLGIPLSRGREFAASDADAMIVRADLARSIWGTDDVVGRVVSGTRRKSYTIVGVTDTRRTGRGLVEGNADAYIAATSARDIAQSPILYVQTVGSAGGRLLELQSLIRRVAPDAPVLRAATVAQLDAEKRTVNVRTGTLASGGGMLALLLAAMGLYAVISFAVAQQSREIGVRMALGATRRQVVGRFFFDGVRMSAVGSIIGIPASVVAVRELFAGMGVNSVGAVGVGCTVAVCVTCVAMIATWIPARRAATVDPVAALRSD